MLPSLAAYRGLLLSWKMTVLMISQLYPLQLVQ